jgi:LysR family nitrogen assimilation transcriptional regulator
MDIRWLRYFVAVAEAGSFSNASRQLSVAQPALSRHVKDVELQLGVTLLIRTARGVTLTDEGETAYAAALNVIRQLDMLPSLVGNRDRIVTGRVSIGLPTSASAVLAGPLLLAALDQLPGVQIHLIESLSGFLRDWVQTGKLDLAVLYDVDPNSSLLVEVLTEEELWLVGAPHLLNRRETISLAEVAAMPLVLPGLQHSMRQLVNAVASRHGLTLSIVAEADSLHIVRTIAASGRAFGILAPSAIRTELQSGVLKAIRIENPSIRRTVSLARPLLHASNRAAEEAGRLCLAVTQNLIAAGLWGVRANGRYVDR